MHRIRQLADELCAALRAFDPARLSGAECADLTERLACVAKACETASARAAARAADCRMHGDDASPADWLARLIGRTRGAASAALETVKNIENCPCTEEALLAGEVSLAQAAEIASVPEHERELLDVARASGLGAVKDEARKRRLAAIDPDELHARQREAREFVSWRDALGMIRFRGALTPEVGVPFLNRLDAETDREWRAARRAGRRESRAALAADAFARMIEGSGRGRSTSADVVIVVDLNAYRRGTAEPGEISQIVGGGPIPVSMARELAEDAFLKVVLHTGVNVHTVSHFGRHIPAVLRTALALGPAPEFDGVKCTEPGCDRRHGLQWDHIDPHANGGMVSFENMKPKCTPHHVEKTERDRRAGLLDGSRKERGPP